MTCTHAHTHTPHGAFHFAGLFCLTHETCLADLRCGLRDSFVFEDLHKHGHTRTQSQAQRRYTVTQTRKHRPTQTQTQRQKQRQRQRQTHTHTSQESRPTQKHQQPHCKHTLRLPAQAVELFNPWARGTERPKAEGLDGANHKDPQEHRNDGRPRRHHQKNVTGHRLAVDFEVVYVCFKAVPLGKPRKINLTSSAF